MVTYNGNQYRTLGNSQPNSRTPGCDRSLQPIPAGWTIAPDDAASAYVARTYYWGTHVLVFSNGNTIRTKNYSQSGKRWAANMLGKSGGNVRTNSCSLRILLKRPAGRQQQQVVQEPNSNDRGGRCWTNNRSWNRVLGGYSSGSIVRCTNKEKNGDLSAGGGGQCKKTRSGKVWCWTKGQASGNTLCKRPGSYGGYYWPIPSQTASELGLGRTRPNGDCATNYFTGRDERRA